MNVIDSATRERAEQEQPTAPTVTVEHCESCEWHDDLCRGHEEGHCESCHWDGDSEMCTAVKW